MTALAIGLAVIVAVVALSLPVYALAPHLLYDLLRRLLRRYARLTPKVQEVDGQPWPYLEGGPPGGLPVVLIHGFGADKDMWSLYGRRLTDRYRLIVPDLPGFGESSRTVGDDYGSEAQARRVRDFLDALQIDACHLGGSSMGGFIALRFAIDYPDRLQTLTLFNNAGVLGPIESELQKAIDGGENLLAMGSADDVKRLLTLVAHKPPPVPKRFRKVIYEESAEHHELLDSIFWEIADEVLRQPLNDRLAEVSAPTLIVWGRHDRLIDVSSVDVLHDGIPRSEAVIFDDVGHVPMIENPKKASAAHRPFIDRHGQTGPGTGSS